MPEIRITREWNRSEAKRPRIQELTAKQAHEELVVSGDMTDELFEYHVRRAKAHCTNIIIRPKCRYIFEPGVITRSIGASVVGSVKERQYQQGAGVRPPPTAPRRGVG